MPSLFRTMFTEALAPLSIVVVSLPLFAYWLRAMHSLVVSDETAIEYSLRVAAMVQMQYPAMMKRIDGGESGSDIYQRLREDLDLIRELKGAPLWSAASIEAKVALAGFSAAGVFYQTLRWTGFAAPQREALVMMASSVRYLSGAAGAHADRQS